MRLTVYIKGVPRLNFSVCYQGKLTNSFRQSMQHRSSDHALSISHCRIESLDVDETKTILPYKGRIR